MKKVYIVGIGMEGRQTLTQQAQEAIDSADCLIGAERMLKPFSDISKNKLTSWDSSEISDYVMSTRFRHLRRAYVRRLWILQRYRESPESASRRRRNGNNQWNILAGILLWKITNPMAGHTNSEPPRRNCECRKDCCNESPLLFPSRRKNYGSRHLQAAL